MSTSQREVMQALCDALSDGSIEADAAGGPRGGNRIIRVRGRIDDRPVLVIRQDVWDPGPFELSLRDVLQVVASGPHLTFTGACRRRNPLDVIARLLGGGGRREPQPIFAARRIDADWRAVFADFERDEFCARLEALSGHEACIKVQIEAGMGIRALFRAGQLGSLEDRLAVIRATVELAAS